ncbi:receptor expression-enhancing protein 1 isoform X2 [Passer montanus]|uniref:receptor expression-enhancing protein 1 isoform X2 n=1 Tax=Passer montanus TaxID=9160 RepID=UPI0019605057|nr:receptor expression-enhancing protein 1 isoform X2 [Passer montanus]
MVSWIISRLVVLIFGTLYPAYYSYKAVKSKDIKEYVKWMMYWIIFALFTTAETFTDIFLCWFPFYYELKIAFVAWLLSPYTKGSSLLYRKFVHPTLSSKEKEIDDCLIQAKDRSYDALVHFGKRGLNVAATAAVMAASKGQGALSERLRSFSMQDLSSIRGDSSSTVPPSVTVRTGSKQSHPKPSRSASEGTGSSVCTCCSVCRLLRVTDERSGRTPIWACQRMGLPSSLSGEKKEIQTGSVSCWWKQKNLCNSFSFHLMCFLCILHTNQPGDSSRKAEGSQYCHRAAVTCAFPQPCTWCQSPVQCWSLMVPAWHSLPAPSMGGKPTLIFDLLPFLFWVSVLLCSTRKHA